MRIRKLLTHLNDALSHAKFERCAFDHIRGAGDRLVTMADGSPVTENKVNDFIRERTDDYRRSWVISPLAEAIALAEGALPHKWESRWVGSQICAHCEFGPNHRLHKVR